MKAVIRKRGTKWYTVIYGRGFVMCEAFRSWLDAWAWLYLEWPRAAEYQSQLNNGANNCQQKFRLPA